MTSKVYRRARLKPPPRQARIRALIEERGEVARPELLEWARDQGLVDHGLIGCTELRTVLIRLRRLGILDYSPERVWLGRNPAKAQNLSRDFEAARKKFSIESKRLISELIQAVSNRRLCHGSLDFGHKGLAS